MHHGAQALEVLAESVPGLASCFDDLVVGIKHPVWAEGLAQVLPDAEVSRLSPRLRCLDDQVAMAACSCSSENFASASAGGIWPSGSSRHRLLNLNPAVGGAGDRLRGAVSLRDERFAGGFGRSPIGRSPDG
jgi:hypothetical protein